MPGLNCWMLPAKALFSPHKPTLLMKRTIGTILTSMGVIFILFACIAFMSDKAVLGFSLTKWETIVPFIVGALFLFVGVGMLNKVAD